LIQRDHLVGVQQQRREHRPLFSLLHRYHHTADTHHKWSQQAKFCFIHGFIGSDQACQRLASTDDRLLTGC